MLDRTAVEIAVAFATLVSPVPFLVLLVVAIVARGRQRAIGDGLAAGLSFTGGLALGTMLLLGDLVVRLPILVILGLLVIGRWRARRRAQAGWMLAGGAVPWSVLWGFYVLVIALGMESFDPATTLVGFALGLIPLVAGLVVAARGDPAPPAPSPAAPLGQPGSRAFGSISAAIRDQSLVGPFGLPELALLGALLVTWIVLALLLPSNIPLIVRALIETIVGAVVGAEAYIRAMSSRTRRAFEAFSWLGEWELARVREVTGRGVPTTRAGAEQWLGSRPERPEELAIRIELLLFVDRIAEARGLLDRIPTPTPNARFEVAALRDLVEWRAGGDGDLPGMEAAAAAIEPADGDERLRAEVSIATAKVRHRMGDGRATPGDAIEPLLEVRERLGHRADGQVGRALRRRLIPTLVVVGLLFGLATMLLQPLVAPGG